MNVYCGSTPFLSMGNFYKLFDSIGLIHTERMQLEEWYQRVLESCLQNEKVSVNEDYKAKAKQFFPVEDKDVLFLAEHNQNAFLLDFWREEDRDGYFLLLYNKPEIALALAFDKGLSSQYYIEKWKSSIKQILSFQRRNRGRSFLVDANAAIASPNVFIQVFNEKTNLFPKNIEYDLVFAEPKILDIFLWLSREILANDEEIKDLVSELEACGMPIVQKKEKVNLTVSTLEKECIRINEVVKKVDTTAQELVEAKQVLDCQIKKSNDLKQENKLYVTQLHQIQEELESLSQIKNNVDFIEEKKLDINQNTVKEVELENELLELQLHQVQEELEYYYIEYQKLSGAYKTNGLDKKVLSEYEKNILYKKVTKKNVKQLFDNVWYKQLAGKHWFSFQHYLSKGWKENISPHPLFDPIYYLEANQLTESIKCPLVHFVAFGNILELTPHPLFDTKWYLSHYPDVKESGINPLIHYLKFGVSDGRNPSKKFNTNKYLKNYLDVQASELNPLVHYVLYGKTEGRIST